MTQTAAQRELTEKVKRKILERPENWDQRNWIQKIEFTRPAEERDEICGTALCTAGWAVIEAGVAKVELRQQTLWGVTEEYVTLVDRVTGASLFPQEVAQELLGLSDDQANEIFFATDVMIPEEMCALIDAVIAWPNDERPEDWYDLKGGRTAIVSRSY